MKKIISALLVFVLLLSGCSSDSAEGTQDDVITIFNLKVEIDDALKAYAKEWTEETGIEVEVKSVGGGADYGASLQAEFQSGNEPDIFVASGDGDFAQWSDVVYDMSDEEWVDNTDLEYVDDEGQVLGFPIAIEGYGLIANTEMLEEVGIDPTTITDSDKLADMFTTLNDNKDELGIEAPLSFTTKETWVTGNHLHSILLGGSGTDVDSSFAAVDEFIAGDADALEYDGYTDYVQMLFDNSVGDLSTIDYDTQVANFTSGKTALLFQGNWVLPNLEAADFDTENLTFIPHMYNENTDDKLAVSVPSFYAVNKNADLDASLQFLNDMAMTEEGQDYIVNQAQMVPAFNNVDIEPSDGLSSSLMQYNSEGNIIPWGFTKFPDGYTMNEYGPLYDNFYKNGDADAFIENVKATAGEVE